MNIIITGGSGYLAPIISQFLARSGHNVLLLSRNFIDPTPFHDNISLLEIDWMCDHPFAHLDYNVDCVIHAAGLNAQSCHKSVHDAFQVNCLNTIKLLNYASQQSNCLFFYLSTVHIYASPLVGCIDESSPSTNLHPYAISKHAGELSVLHYLNSTSLSGAVLRLSNIFGPPIFPDSDCWQLYVNNICYDAVIKGRITIKSNPNLQMDVVPVSDLCFLIQYLLSLSPALIPDVINVSKGASDSLYHIAERVSLLTSSLLSFSPEIFYNPSLSNDLPMKPLNLIPNALRSLSPSFSVGSNINVELSDLIIYIKNNLS